MHDSNQQELFSRAYALAVIGAAGYNILQPAIDRHSIDFVIQGDAGPNPYPTINIQIKSTTLDRLSSDHFRFRLERKNYDDLRRPSTTPFLLVVVVVPKDITRWVSGSERALLLRRCGYWMSLVGYPPLTTESTTLVIPRHQRFTVEFLQASMRALEAGGPL